MSRMRLCTAVAGIVLVAGCAAAAPPATTPAPTSAATSTVQSTAPSSTSSSATSTPPAVPAGALALTGDLKSPKTLDAAALAAFPQQSVEVSFQSSGGAQKHTEKGVPLAEILPVSELATTDAKNDQLSFAVLAVGADGYSAAIAYGDVLPDFGNRGLLISLSEDGTALERPRLVVPGDVKGGRYVSDLVELKVVRLPER